MKKCHRWCLSMNSHVQKYYRKSKGQPEPCGNFYEVIPLHEDKGHSWKKLHDKVPSVPRGWHELSQLGLKDRIEFLREFWLSTLPFIPHVHKSIDEFFNSLDDIGVFLIQWKQGLSYECEIVYSLKDDTCFYHGAPPAESKEIVLLNDQFGGYLPKDFLQFLLIHNGFSKHTDTGIFRAQDMPRIQRRLVQDANDINLIVKCREHLINPSDLIPFYESFGQRAYQCFFREWYPTDEMGNVFFSIKEKVISDFQNPHSPSDTLAFSTFSDWLSFYLENVGA